MRFLDMDALFIDAQSRPVLCIDNHESCDQLTIFEPLRILVAASKGFVMKSDCCESPLNFYTMGRNITALMRKFKANLYLAKKTDEGCPSKGQNEGDKTVRPSPEMVGKAHEALME